MLKGEQILEIRGLTCNEGLEYKVKPFPEGMNEAGTVRADRACADGSLVDFYSQVEIPKRIGPVLHGVVVDVVYGIFGESITHAILACPLVDLCVEVGCS